MCGMANNNRFWISCNSMNMKVILRFHAKPLFQCICVIKVYNKAIIWESKTTALFLYIKMS